MTGLLAGKVVLVTGAASGIGRAAALAFAADGALLALADRDAAGLGDTVRMLPGQDVLAEAVDITDGSRVHALVAATLARFGRLDGAFNNAGIEGCGGRMVPLPDYPDDQFAAVQAVNVQGLWHCLKAELAAMLPARRGAIVNTASVMGAVAAPGMSAYVASKHAVMGLTRAAALDAAPHGIRVNAVLPGGVRTPMLLERGFTENPGFAAAAAALHPLGRLAEPEEVAHAAAWLLSDRAGFVTGHGLVVDGGLTVM